MVSESEIIVLKDRVSFTKHADSSVAPREKSVRFYDMPQRANAFVIKSIAAQEGRLDTETSLAKIHMRGAFDLNQTGPKRSLLAF